ncbi:glycine betaine ABC transporter substrate-binding protein [Cutibacterium sp.]|uniref:glycine betaine ABC transporter substrate-binding protein n=1 Tax=Cutibacterium sp. TaxID=1912221 RepID=UPI0026DAE6DE|nr:glycine betaine ABC transporter substrate-binding protein [Cutibacterium sp.]MDO4413311.1 glycine betaine ABC transporter substrate-binding protein [Cutibacterium sp.]
MVRRKVIGVVSTLTIGAIALSGCGATNSGSGEGDSSATGSNNVDKKWVECTPGDGSKDTGSMKADADNKITIGAFNGWDESFATAGILKNVLEKDGYTVTIKGFDAGPGYAGLVGGDIDLITDGWLPLTHADYVKRYGDKMENLGCWYDNAKLTIAVNKDSKAKTIGDLKSMGDEYGNTLYGIEAGAGLTKTTKDSAIPKYDLKNLNFKISSTPAMLAQLKKSTDAGQDIAVTLWRPHWAYDAFPVRDLEDPEKAMGEAEVLYSFGRPGFEKDHPKAAQLVRNMVFDDDTLSSLENTMFSSENYGGENQEKAVTEWTSNNKEWVDKLKSGELAGK